MSERTARGPTAGLLLDARRRAGLSQRQLAVLAGTSPAAIAQYETGRRDPTVATLARIIEACGMELCMTATDLDLAARAQRSRDAAVDPQDARRNAERARCEVIEIVPA